MLFNSVNFLLFFPAVCLIYFLIPQKGRLVWLLAAIYWFYMSWNVRYVLLLAGCTAITYLCGLKIETSVSARAKKGWLAASLISCLGILFFFKYIDFTLQNIDAVCRTVLHFSLPVARFDILLPVGISFYTFQALSYCLDVYRGTIKAEHNFLHYALYVSFFPQLVAGPIERSMNLLPQVAQTHVFDADRVRDGLLLMLWGFFEKLVIADNAAIFVNRVFEGYTQYGGGIRLAALVLFSFQIYCDFGGYSHIAIGAAQVLGFELMNNFRQPYLACGIGDFWKRWHISLSGWLRDYLYIPLGGNRKGRPRKYLNLFITFFISGLWHGAAWHFVLWGALHAAYQIAEDALKPAYIRLNAMFGGEAGKGCLAVCAKRLAVFVLTMAAWLFFRADSLRMAMDYAYGILRCFELGQLFDGTLFSLGLDRANAFVLFCSLLILFAVDLAHEHGLRLRRIFTGQRLVYRWALYYGCIFWILIFGVWGPNYSEAAFIYFQF